MSDPNINHLNRVSEAMIIPNIIQFLELEETTIAGATLRGGINFKHADGASGDSITFVATDDSGNDRTNLQLQFNANLEDLEDVTRVGAAAGHMMVYNDATDKYTSQPITGHATVGTGGVVTLSVDVVGITNLNVATHGSSGHILFNNDGGLNFIQPVLSHLGDVDNTGVSDAKILIYDAAAGVYKPQNIGTDANLSKAGVLNLTDNSVGTDELQGLGTAGSVGWSVGPDGSGGLRFLTNIVDVRDIAGPPAGHTAIMFHNGVTAFFEEGLNIPSLTFDQRGACGGIVSGSEFVGSPGVGTSNVLGVTGEPGTSNFRWAWLNVTEIGTGATGVAGLEEMSLATPILDGHVFIGNNSSGSFTNRVVSGDVTINAAGAVAIGAGKVTNAMMANAGGITLATPVGSGLTYSSGGGTDVAGAGVTLGGDHALKVEVDDDTIQVTSSNELRIKDDGIAAAKLKTDSVTTAKIVNANVTNNKLVDGNIQNVKLANSVITFTADSGSRAIDLGDTLTVSGTDPIDTSQSGDTLTLSIDTATTSALGAAKFNTNNFVVNSGDVNIKVGGITAGSIAADSILAAGIADGAVGLSAMNIKSGEHGASGHVMIRFGDGTNQEFGFVPQSSVTASLTANDITDINSGVAYSKAQNQVLMIGADNSTYYNFQLDHTHMANINPKRILGLGDSSASAPTELTANQVIDIINADGSTDWDADLLPSGIAYLTESSDQNFTGPISIGGTMKLGKSGSETSGTDISIDAQAHVNCSHHWTQACAEQMRFFAGQSNLDDLNEDQLAAISVNSYTGNPDLLISSLGYVGIGGMTDAFYPLDVNGSMRVSGDCFLGTADHGRVVIGHTNSGAQDNTNANFLHISRGAASHGSYLALSHDDSGGSNDFGGIFFGTYDDGYPDDGTDSLILGTGRGASSQLAFRTDGIFRFADRAQDTVHMSIGTDGQIAMGTGHGTTSNAAGTLLHLWEEDTYIWTDSSHEFSLGTDHKTSRGLIHLDVYSTTDQDGHRGKGGAITFGGHDTTTPVVAGIYVATDGAYGSKMAFATTTNYSTGPQTRMVIDDVGDIGINRNPSASYKLAIDGGLLATTIEASSNVRCETLTVGNGQNDGIRAKTTADYSGVLFFSSSGPYLMRTDADGVYDSGNGVMIRDGKIVMASTHSDGTTESYLDLSGVDYLQLPGGQKLYGVEGWQYNSSNDATGNYSTSAGTWGTNKGPTQTWDNNGIKSIRIFCDNFKISGSNYDAHCYQVRQNGTWKTSGYASGIFISGNYGGSTTTSIPMASNAAQVHQTQDYNVYIDRSGLFSGDLRHYYGNANNGNIYGTYYGISERSGSASLQYHTPNTGYTHGVLTHLAESSIALLDIDGIRFSRGATDDGTLYTNKMRAYWWYF